MQYTYIASDNTAAVATTAGTPLGADNEEVVIYGIYWGLPSDAHYIKIYDKVNVVLNATTNLAAFITQPSHAAGLETIRYIDFGPKGLHLGEGGNVVTNGNQITVIWERV